MRARASQTFNELSFSDLGTYLALIPRINTPRQDQRTALGAAVSPVEQHVRPALGPRLISVPQKAEAPLCANSFLHCRKKSLARRRGWLQLYSKPRLGLDPWPLGKLSVWSFVVVNAVRPSLLASRHCRFHATGPGRPADQRDSSAQDAGAKEPRGFMQWSF